MRRPRVIALIAWLCLAVAPADAQPEVAGQCFCDAGGGIAINQLIRAVNVALGSAECPAMPVVTAPPTPTAVDAPTATVTPPATATATGTVAPTSSAAPTDTVAPTATPSVTATASPAPTRFEDTGLTVIDHQTGLEWVKTDENGGLTDKSQAFPWSQSGTAPDGTAFTVYLRGLNDAAYAGHDDWRLPTSASFASSGALHAGELESIVDCSQTPCIDPIFGPTSAALHWSSSTVAELPSAASSVSFANGFTSLDGKNLELVVRAVRGGAVPPPRFTDTGLTVIDEQTGLEWVKSDDSGGLTDRDDVFAFGLSETSSDGSLASVYLANLNAAAFAGHSDWRLPSSAGGGPQPLQPAEVESILDCSYTPCIHPVFGPSQIGYWTSSLVVDQPTLVSTGRLSDGTIDSLNRTQEFFARAVRNRPNTAALPRVVDTGLTVIDRQTGLEWVKTDDGGGLTDRNRSFTWSTTGIAADGTVFSEYLAGLNVANYAGHDDWRLPTSTLGPSTLGQAEELGSLVDCSFPSCIDPIFGPVAAASYWSSTTDPDGADLALATLFPTGTAGGVSKQAPVRARAVRGGAAPPPRFIDTGFTVIDRATGLEWVKSDDAGGLTDKDRNFSWSASGTAADGTAFTTYLAGLNAANYAGHDDWRLPSSAAGAIDGALQAAEIESLVDCSYPRCTHPLFGPAADGRYWSASTRPDAPDAAFDVVFADGANGLTVGNPNKSSIRRVRAVRDRP